MRTHDLVVVANRLPVQRVNGVWTTSPGGLVRAMLGVLRTRHGAWVGWTGDTDSPPADPFDRWPGDDVLIAGVTDVADGSPEPDVPVPVDLDGTELVPVPLSEEDFTHYYERVSNGALWPLFHDAIRESTFDAASWTVYRDVNRRFAEAAAAAAAPNATVWVHDYHLTLVPEMLRELRPDLVIGFFLHIPFPPQELFMRMPWRDEILRGLLGADLIGFQRSVGAENFIGLVKRLLGADTDGDLVVHDRVTRVGTFPISIDVDEVVRLAERPGMAALTREIRERLGNPRTVYLGVDRLDYTKGIDLRLISFGALLRECASDDDGSSPSAVLIQVAVPGREGVGSYADERKVVDQLVGDVNGEHAEIGFPVVHYVRRSLTLEQLIPLYMAADVMLVTPRRDGMNLVAKEFVASRIHDDGVLILSEFAGAADELTDAIVVNPHDPDAIVAAMNEALTMTSAEAGRRMKSIRAIVGAHDVHEWAHHFLVALRDPVPVSGPSGAERG